MAGMRQSPTAILCAALGVALVNGGCRGRPAADRLVLAQAPAGAAIPAEADLLDARYPPGSRIVLVSEPFAGAPERILSANFAAAGQPVLSYDGERVFFAGKPKLGDDWQIFEVSVRGGRPRGWTSAPGGAMSPALLGDGRLVFVSPVPRSGDDAAEAGASPPAIYVQARGEPAQRISFAPGGLSDPTVLADGRILAGGPPPSAPVGESAANRTFVYTLNNDGTEITGFSGHHDSAALLRRPRELPDGRVVVLVEDGDVQGEDGAGRPEWVAMARPFGGRQSLLADASIRVQAVEPAATDRLLVTAALPSADAFPRPVLALYRVALQASVLGDPLIADPEWSILSGLAVLPRRPPMGRLSTVKPDSTTATVLCLDANESALAGAVATRVRVLAASESGEVLALGEVDLQADGSFMAEVPADVPLGFETLDQDGRSVRRLEPMIWMRPGENRSCIGCHEPRSFAPRNRRPLAVSVPIPRLVGLPPPPVATP